MKVDEMCVTHDVHLTCNTHKKTHLKLFQTSSLDTRRKSRSRWIIFASLFGSCGSKEFLVDLLGRSNPRILCLLNLAC